MKMKAQNCQQNGKVCLHISGQELWRQTKEICSSIVVERKGICQLLNRISKGRINELRKSYFIYTNITILQAARIRYRCHVCSVTCAISLFLLYLIQCRLTSQ